MATLNEEIKEKGVYGGTQNLDGEINAGGVFGEIQMPNNETKAEGVFSAVEMPNSGMNLGNIFGGNTKEETKVEGVFGELKYQIMEQIQKIYLIKIKMKKQKEYLEK